MDSTSSVPQTVMAYVRFPVSSGPDLLLVPAYSVLVSACILLLYSLFAPKSIHDQLERVGLVSEPSPGIGYRVARLLGCLALLGLSISSIVDQVSGAREELIRRIIMSTPYLYASILTFLSGPKHTRQRLIRHAEFVLLISFCVYVYRDIIPFATFNRSPLDGGEGKMLWAKVVLLFFTAVIIPLFTPRQYTPIDPENPMTAPNPEQTASIFSFAFYFFLDKIIFLAYRESQLSEDELYPLCDTDRSIRLKDRSFKYLDSYSGGNAMARRHIFFGLMRVFWQEFSILPFLLLLLVLANISGPFALNRLLEFIETRQQVDTHIVRPWVWILVILLGPILGSIALQWYKFISTRTLVRAEAIITQLVFAHSLRIRMKAETSETKDKDGDLPAVETPSSSSIFRNGSDADTPEGTATPDDSTTVHAGTSSIKSATSNAKGTPQLAKPSTPAKEKEDSKKSQGSLVGKINNLVTTDLGNIVHSRDFLVLLVFVPFQTGLGIYLLYVLLGWSVWVGVASIILLAPLPGYLAKFVQTTQKERLKWTDERVQRVSEAVNVLRMIKLFGWEEKMKDRIGQKRTSELVWIRKRRFIDMASTLIKYVTLIMGQSLTAAKVFSSMTIFDLLKQITLWLNNLMTGKVSLDRVNDFLKKSELLDAFDTKKNPVLFTPDPAEDERIGFRNATFSWSKETDGSLTQSQRQFTLRIDGEVLFERGRINVVVGPTGSGKTSLLMALLGEMHWIPSSPDSWYNLPRSSGIAYATQESWVLNETIRTNIIFDSPYDEERYKMVLYACALEQDIKLFEAGDETEVGEKGLTLSGGQKARLTLARAAVSDVQFEYVPFWRLFAVHTAQWIVEKLFSSDLIQNRTVILVTHNVALICPIADFIVTFGSDGRVQAKGSVSEITQRGSIAAQIREEQQVLAQQQVDATEKPAVGKLILAEEMEMGHVSAAALKMYLSSTGGRYPVLFFLFFFGGLTFTQVLNTVRTWVLGYWAKQYDHLPADEVDVVFIETSIATSLSSVTALVFASMVCTTIVYVYLVFGQLRASTVIHKNLINSVLSAPLRWFDVTPVSRIIARVTNDIRAVDDPISMQFWVLSIMIISVMVKICAIVINAPVFVFPSLLVGVIGAWIGQIYIAGQLPVKRMMSNNRAPVLAHTKVISAVSIRAFGAQAKFNSESLVRIDRYTRAARNYHNLNCWVSVRVDMLGSMFSAGLATYLLYITRATAADAGFLMNMAVTFTRMLLWIVISLNEFEVQVLTISSLERIQQYINMEHEKPATEAGAPPAYWPASGDLRVEHLTARYSEDGPNVLHDISFHIKSGERVGIVGRTGSGKSSLTLSLLRCIPTDGSVRFDGIETSKLNLDALRSSITIIPQVPELLSGTLRMNLDPFGQIDDTELNNALRAAGLFALQNEMDEGKITLDSAVSSGGSNLSVGQRQIFALASSNSIIQNSLRQELRGDVSLITVAHRLQTIMDADKIVEFGHPEELLKIEDGKLRALVDESGDKDVLYAMAGAS
ncbi:hypothetical protein GGX14DRAFT_444201 [Mycena pura]|uniref:ATP-binding cassette transporter n=1 Tax=Mycena pura TaxID=153505 RepID=A0AAD6VJC8_9AGAR|nr:hypothetical protein GGX14DRAFT_444201 [Mycena pura]